MSKFSPSQLMSGMAAGMDFMSMFYKLIIANGGGSQLIHYMTLPANAQKLEDLAKYAVSQYYPVPRSEIEQEVIKESVECHGREYVETDKCYTWTMARLEETYGIQVIDFGEDYDLPIPSELGRQIEGKPLPYPLLVDWKGERYVVAYLSLVGDVDPMPGMICPEIRILRIASARYFDLES